MRESVALSLKLKTKWWPGQSIKNIQLFPLFVLWVYPGSAPTCCTWFVDRCDKGMQSNLNPQIKQLFPSCLTSDEKTKKYIDKNIITNNEYSFVLCYVVKWRVLTFKRAEDHYHCRPGFKSHQQHFPQTYWILWTDVPWIVKSIMTSQQLLAGASVAQVIELLPICSGDVFDSCHGRFCGNECTVNGWLRITVCVNWFLWMT